MRVGHVDPCEVFAADLSSLLARPAWHRDAACAEHDPALWFPPPPTPGVNTSAMAARAKAICGGCLVLDDCRAWALDQVAAGVDLAGIWAGTSAPERRRLVGEAA